MDAKIFKKVLVDEPKEEDFIYWEKMLSLYLDKARVLEDCKLQVLFVLCGVKAFTII